MIVEHESYRELVTRSSLVSIIRGERERGRERERGMSMKWIGIGNSKEMTKLPLWKLLAVLNSE